jgi:hypothetical protein
MTPAKKQGGLKKPAEAKPDEAFVDEGIALQEKFITEFGEVDIAAPETILARMGARYDRAESIEDLFDALQGQSSDAMVGRKFRFLDVSWQPYQTEKGVIPLAVCDVVDLDSGEQTEFVTTGYMLVRFIRRAIQLGVMPFEARIVGKKTNSGQTALNFERV